MYLRLSICLVALRNQVFSLSSKCLSFFALEKVLEIMYYMPLWERINLELECIEIIVLIGFELFFFPPCFSVFTVAGKKWGFVAISHISFC